MRNRDTVFATKSGKLLIMDVELGANHLYSPDGVTYYVIYGGVGRSRRFDNGIPEELICEEFGRFHIPSLDIDEPFDRDRDILTWNGEVFTRTDETFDRQSAKLVELPQTRQSEYLAFSEDGSLVVYVSASKYKFSYESFRLFVGNGAEMREIKIQNVTRYRDGGTTIITTNEGTFFSPTAFDKATTWLNNKLAEVRRNEIADTYNIVEDEDGTVLSVTKKS